MFWKIFGKKENGEDRRVKRALKKLTNKYQQTQERKKAIEDLAEIGTQEAISALLQRFTFTTEQTIIDEEEKDIVFRTIISFGEKSVSPIIKFINENSYVYWPLKALREIVGEKRTAEELIKAIDAVEEIYEQDTKRKIQLVSNLREFNISETKEKLLQLLHSENEEIRVLAIDGLSVYGEDVSSVLIDRLLMEEETQRIKTFILDLLIDKKWRIKRFKKEILKAIPENFWIDDTGVVRRR